MKRLRRVALVLILSFSCACSSNPHKLKITEQNKDNFLDSIKKSKGLTVEEIRLLMAYTMRGAVAQGLGSKQLSPVGKTVGELIEEQRKWEASLKEEGEKEKRLAAEAKAKEDATAAELRKNLALTVFEKKFLPSDFESGRYEDTIVIKCAYENDSSKDIRAFQGQIVFRDLFGDTIATSGIKISEPIKAGQKKTWVGGIRFNQFLDTDRKLKNTDLNDMKIEWRPKTILFADGSKLGEESSEK